MVVVEVERALVVVREPGIDVVVVDALGVSIVTVLGPVGLFASHPMTSAASNNPNRSGLRIQVVSRTRHLVIDAT